MKVPFIDLKTQYNALKEDIDAGIHRVLDHGMYVNGPEVKECEAELAKFVKTKDAVVAASGTDALIMALLAIGLKPGDEVITTPFSFIATVESIVLLGGVPVYVDIEPDTYNLDVSKVEAAITDKTKAIMPVGLYGQAADMDELSDLTSKHNLYLIEDAAQSFGAKYKDRFSGGLGHISCTSFFPAKPLGCYGDGGTCTTNDESLAQTLREIRDHGSESRYYHTRIGVNGRMDSMQCAVVLAKLKRFGWEIEQRDRVANFYSEALKDVKDLQLPVVRDDRGSTWAQYTLKVEKPRRCASEA
jgi:UDP-2-acetamido-2-deoxy-ribo-hexuluronate aminotransferase